METFAVPILFVIEAPTQNAAHECAADMCEHARTVGAQQRRTSAYLDEKLLTKEIQPTEEGPFSYVDA